ncbi:MAG: methylated-DNA--[protein]-cysteine S-methyltransferase [Rhodospirillaceae bacterium]
MTTELTLDSLCRALQASRGALDGAPDPRLRCRLETGRRLPAALAWGRHGTPFGPVLAAATSGDLCWLAFIKDGDADALRRLARAWPGATLTEQPAATADAVALAFHPGHRLAAPLPVLLAGTPFQLAVWQALLRIPAGALVSYGDLAAAVGRPRAVRAAGSAVGANPVSVLVPCHRVIAKAGDPFKYGGGPERKRALLTWELIAAGSA